MNGNSDLPLSASALHISSDKNRKASPCVFCDKANHKSQFCKTVTDIVKRKEILKKKKRCFRCLKAVLFQSSVHQNCQCHNCQGRHHLAVCKAGYNLKSTSLQPNAPAFQPLQQQMSTIAPPLAPQNNSSITCTVSADTPKSVLLQTVIASINGVHCRLLFDSGSPLSYISPSLFKKINLKSECTQQFKLNVFGANSTVENLDYVKVEIESFSNTESIFVKCYVKDITKPIPNQYNNFAKNSSQNLKHLSLADYNDDRDLSVDILIGSDYYWDIIENEVVRA